jgi:Flp pilus assembly protein TadD
MPAPKVIAGWAGWSIVRNGAHWAARFAVLVIVVSTVTSPSLSRPAVFVADGQFGRALQIHPDDRALLRVWTTALLRAGQPVQAEAVARLWAAQHGWDGEASSLLGQAIAAQKPDQGALRNRIKAVDGDSLKTALSQDLVLRDWASARRHLAALRATIGEAVIQRDPALAALSAAFATPDDLAALSTIGSTFITQDRFSLAEYIFSRQIGLDGGAAPSLALAALSQDAQGRDGWPLLEQALTLAPEDTTVNFAAALHWRTRGDYDRALAALGAATQKEPTNPALAVEIGVVYRLRGQQAEAARWYQRAVQLAPGEASFYRTLIAFYLDDGYQVEPGPLATARDAIRRFPEDAELQALFAQAILAPGLGAPVTQPGPAAPTPDRDQAKAALDHALAIDPSNLRARYFLAVYWDQTGQAAAARDAYRIVAEHAESPFADLAQRALARP